jgi:hypothetical protein
MDNIAEMPEYYEYLPEELDDPGISQENKSIFLEDVRMSLSDECMKSGVRQTVLFANAAGRVGSKITILSHEFITRMPEMLKNFSLIRETLDGSNPDDLECWIELHHGHVPIGILVTHWKAHKDPNPYFMLRRFHLDRADKAPYSAIWRGTDFMNEAPLAKCVDFKHVATSNNKMAIPLIPDMRKGAIAIVAIAWAAMAYRLNPSLVPGIDQTVVRNQIFEKENLVAA